MKENAISFNIAADGAVFGCPSRILIGKQNGELVFCGTLQWGGKKLSDALQEVDKEMSGRFQGYVDDLLPDQMPGELTVLYQKSRLELGVQDDGLYFKVAKIGEGAAVLFAFQMKDCRQDESGLVAALGTAADFFGIQEFLFYAQTGHQWLLPQMRPGKNAGSEVPSEIKACSLLAHAHISIDDRSNFTRALHMLFGWNETDLYVGMSGKQFLCMMSLPSFSTSFMKGSGMYVKMELGDRPSFLMKGSFVFSFLPEVTFTVDCGVDEGEFALEAYMHVEKPVPLFSIFSIGDTCLMIRVLNGISFGMYTNLYIRNIQLFGALILKIQGNVVTPDLLSAAVSDLSIPVLVNNLMGRPLAEIEVLDFIQLTGLSFQNMDRFEPEVVQKKAVSEIVCQFNSQLSDASLSLDESQVQLTPFGDGADLTDLRRMRHYYIDKSGNLKLMAQFYYATENTKLGNYTVERGLFICAAIEIFKKRFEVLFSFREKDGLLAYAKVPSIDLGFLKIGPSAFGSQGNGSLPLAKDSIITQFVNPQADGVIFFLTAGEKEISFYFDGMVEFLSLFRVDARIIFCKKMISVDLRTICFRVLQISLHISVRYDSFASGGFAFCLVIDTSKLTEMLQAVTRNIDNAIQRLRNKIDNAKREIDRAQAHVNELYGQIHNFDRKIEDCRRAIRDASWWEKAFVAIGKGIEIGAYEVAKAGVYAAIGVATAALQVAKSVVDLSGKIGEGVLKAVNEVIRGAMTLFYVNYMKLEAKADIREQYFQAEIEFVALGKTYKLNKTIGKRALEQSADGAISGVINDKIQPDLDNIENGAFKSNWRKYQHENYTVEQHCRRLDQAKKHMNSSISMMTQMQNIYTEKFQMSMQEFDEMNVSMAGALDDVKNVLDTGARAGDVSKLANAMGGLKRSVAAREKQGVFREEELSETKKVIASYDEARVFYNKVISSASDVQEHQRQMERQQSIIHDMTRNSSGECTVRGSEGDMADVLLEVEQQMYKYFPVDRSGTDFINLSREALIRESFEGAEKKLGITPPEKIQSMRSRSSKGKYENRL